MGTSGAYKGSADGRDLRDAISDWLAGDGAPDDGAGGPDDDSGADAPLPSIAGPAISIWQRGPRTSSGSGGGAGGGGGRAGGGGGSGGRGYGGAQRSVGRVAGPAGRAGTLARAYATGDRDLLRAVGLDYDALRALDDPLAIAQQIANAAFDAVPDSTIEDSEARLIVANLSIWALDAPDGQPRTPDELVRQSIALMIEQGILVESGDTIRAESSQARRLELEREIHDSAQVWAARVELDATGASAAEMTAAIDDGVAQLGRIFGGNS